MIHRLIVPIDNESDKVMSKKLEIGGSDAAQKSLIDSICRKQTAGIHPDPVEKAFYKEKGSREG